MPWVFVAVARADVLLHHDRVQRHVQRMDVPVSYFAVAFCRCCVGAMLVVVVVLASLLSV